MVARQHLDLGAAAGKGDPGRRRIGRGAAVGGVGGVAAVGGAGSAGRGVGGAGHDCNAGRAGRAGRADRADRAGCGGRPAAPREQQSHAARIRSRPVAVERLQRGAVEREEAFRLRGPQLARQQAHRLGLGDHLRHGLLGAEGAEARVAGAGCHGGVAAGQRHEVACEREPQRALVRGLLPGPPLEPPRRRGIDQGQQIDRLAGGEELPRHLVGDHAAERPAAQRIGAGRRGRPDRRDVAGGQRLDRGSGLEGFRVGQLQGAERLARSERPRQLRVAEDIAAGRMDEEQRHGRRACRRRRQLDQDAAAGGHRAGGQHGCQALDGSGAKQRRQGELAAATLADARHQAHGQQRVATEGEEAVAHAHLLHPQHLGPQACQQRFERGAGGDAAPGPGGLTPGCRGVRQRREIELAARRQRQPLDERPVGGHHRVGQPRGERPAEVLDRGPRLAARHQVGCQATLRRAPAIAGPRDGGRRRRAHHHRRRRHARLRRQHGLDLAELDADAADLDLAVDASQELDDPRGALAHAVAGAVDPASRLLRVAGAGIGEEGRGGEIGPRQVAARQADAADAQLAGGPGRHLALSGVEDVETSPRDRPPERHARPGGVAAAPPLGDRDGGLGRAVARQQEWRRVRHRGGEAARQVARHPLAAGHHPAQRAAAAEGLLGQQGREQRGRKVEVGDLLLGDQVRQPAGVLAARGPSQHHRRARPQRREELDHRDVEAERRALQHPCARLEICRELVAQTVRHRAVRDDHPLRHTRGAGGVEDVRGVVRMGLRMGGRRQPAWLRATRATRAILAILAILAIRPIRASRRIRAIRAIRLIRAIRTIRASGRLAPLCPGPEVEPHDAE